MNRNTSSVPFSPTTPISPPSGPDHWLFQGPPAQSKFLAAENPAKPLSDDAITKALQKQGIKVARRTISRYREQLNILPSHLRKSF